MFQAKDDEDNLFDNNFGEQREYLDRRLQEFQRKISYSHQVVTARNYEQQIQDYITVMRHVMTKWEHSFIFEKLYHTNVDFFTNPALKASDLQKLESELPAILYHPKSQYLVRQKFQKQHPSLLHVFFKNQNPFAQKNSEQEQRCKDLVALMKNHLFNDKIVASLEVLSQVSIKSEEVFNKIYQSTKWTHTDLSEEELRSIEAKVEVPEVEDEDDEDQVDARDDAEATNNQAGERISADYRTYFSKVAEQLI